MFSEEGEVFFGASSSSRISLLIPHKRPSSDAAYLQQLLLWPEKRGPDFLQKGRSQNIGASQPSQFIGTVCSEVGVEVKLKYFLEADDDLRLQQWHPRDFISSHIPLPRSVKTTISWFSSAIVSRAFSSSCFTKRVVYSKSPLSRAVEYNSCRSQSISINMGYNMDGFRASLSRLHTCLLLSVLPSSQTLFSPRFSTCLNLILFLIFVFVPIPGVDSVIFSISFYFRTPDIL